MAQRGDTITLPGGETAVILSLNVLECPNLGLTTHLVRVGDRGCDAEGCQHADIRTVTMPMVESP